jgi:hypothetical protein
MLRSRIGLVEARQERTARVGGVTVSAGSTSVSIPGEMTTGDYAEYWGEGSIHVFDRNGKSLLTAPVRVRPRLKKGENELSVGAGRPENFVLTTITLSQ